MPGRHTGMTATDVVIGYARKGSDRRHDHMNVRNADIAAVFDEIADLLELNQANTFRVRAYRNAARTIDEWPEEMAGWVKVGRDFEELPGVGADLAGKISEILRHGSCAQLRRLRGGFPRGITNLLQVPGLGPRRVHALYHELGVHSPEQLLAAAREHRIRNLHGFGEASERRIADSVAGYLRRSSRWPIAHVEAEAEALLDWLRAAPGVSDAVIAGSYRRRRDTVGDIDILLATTRRRDGQVLGVRLARYERTSRVLARGTTRSSIVLESGLQVDLRVVPLDSFGAALVYFTGSKPHNIALRRLARGRGLKINEYGVYTTSKGGVGTRTAGTTENSVYASIGLPWIAPELREDHGEIEAAQAGRLPVLIERADLRGDLHAHTNASDGRESLEQMVRAARAVGLEYLAITDHSRSLAVANGLDADRLIAHCNAIDRFNAKLPGFALLKGIEVEIMKNGRLDLPDNVLAYLDLVVGAVHSAFDLPREKQTTRILKAMDRPNFSILAHPNARLLGRRGPCDVDIDRVIRHASERGCFLELNAQPDRLDLFDLQCRQAKEAGVLVAISSDAHCGADFHWLRLGIDQARRGWLERGNVLNTLPLAKLRRRLAVTMTRSP